MKKTILLSLINLAMAAGAYASCPNLSGNYKPFVAPWGGNEAGPYGKVVISKAQETADSCKYTLTSKVKDFAAPLANGIQILKVSKSNGDMGSEYQILNVNGKPIDLGKGILTVGSEGQITLSFGLTGCGGEGSGSNCGEDLILR